MLSFEHAELPAAGVASLVWRGDSLIDWVRGGQTFELDGSHSPRKVNYAYHFDSATQSPSGRFTIIYERLGTKGLVLRDSSVIREINRSFYWANAYEFPVALIQLRDGREAIVHCPDTYNRLELDDLETGERLTTRPSGSPEAADFFHSGLAADASGSWLMSAGWIWHPMRFVNVYRLADALQDPSVLDGRGQRLPVEVEVASAVFLEKDRLCLAAAPDAEDFRDGTDEPREGMVAGSLGVLDIPSAKVESVVPFPEPAGRMFAVDGEHVLALYQHPKLIHLPTGRIIARWPDINSGTWNGCIDTARSVQPALAWDALGGRLAVASDNKIDVLIRSE